MQYIVILVWVSMIIVDIVNQMYPLYEQQSGIGETRSYLSLTISL